MSRAWLWFLLLAAATVAAAEPEPEWRYTIRPGDTLIGVSRQYLAEPRDWPRLARLNRVVDPQRLMPGTTLRIPLAMLRQTAAPAELVAVSGEVLLTLPQAPPRPAVAGDRLPAGTILVTAANSSAGIRFADGSRLTLQPGSRMALDTVSVYAGGGMADTRLRLQEGRAEIQANPQKARGNRLEVITPSAVAAVRGTHFRVAAAADAAREETLAGNVAVMAVDETVSVGEGFGTRVERGQPPRPPVALLPAPDVGDLPARIERLPVAFAVGAVAGAAAWHGEIAADAEFTRILLEKTSDTPRLVFADLPDGDYVLRVRAVDALGLQGRDAQHAFVVAARPFPPLPLAPGQGGVVREAQPPLRWAQVEGIGTYRIELAADAAFAQPVAAQSVEGAAWTPDPLAPGTYFWRVASVAGGKRGPWSDAMRFTYSALPGAPDLGTPAIEFDRDVMRVRLAPPPAGLAYAVELAADPGGGTVLWRGSSASGALAMPRPDAGRVYLAARLVEADGTAGPTATRVIEVPRRHEWAWLLLLLPLLAL